MITATFSNGHTDTYKGTRPVKAAWAIIRKSDSAVMMTGHSLDRAKAQATAEGNFRYTASKVIGRMLKGLSDRPDRDARRNAYFNSLAKKNGFSNWKEAYAAYQADLADVRALVTIEVIDL